MALEYITIDELAARLCIDEYTDAEEVEATALVESVSRFADDELEVIEGYYLPEDEPRTERVYGTGSSSMDLPKPLYGTVEVVAPPNYSIPDFALEGNTLYTVTETGLRSAYLVWGEGVPFDITGMWGYIRTPPQLKEACLQIAARIWKEKPISGFEGLVTDIRQYEGIAARGIPSIAQRIFNNMKRKAPSETSTNALYIA